MDTPLVVSADAARRFLVRQFALDGFQTLPDVTGAIDRLEFVQEDSINICSRIHDQILWSRVKGYKPELLHRTLYKTPRAAFEYYFPNLCALPIGDYPYFLHRMRRRAEALPGPWQGIEEHEVSVVERVLAEIDAHGPLRTRATSTEEGHTTSGWGTRTSIAARAIDKLWLHGRLTVARRENFERWFDRTERLLPDVAGLALPDEAETNLYLARKRLRARRLFRPKRDDAALLGASALRPVTVEGAKRPWYILSEDTDALLAETGDAAQDIEPVAHLLAPLDPVIYDRDRNREIFDFDYTWEVYTPAAKRRWGYYVLPILFRDRIVGRLDPKIDRRTGTLQIVSLRLEPGVREPEVGAAIVARLKRYAKFVGATNITWETVEPERLRRRLEKAFG